NKDVEFYDFRGFYFPESFDFEVIYEYLKDRTFDKEVYFAEAIFQDIADFHGAVFQRRVQFEKTTFEKFAKFGNVIFQEFADFRGAKFNGAFFLGAKFESADFAQTVIEKNANFRDVKFEKFADFRGAKFQMAEFTHATFESWVTFEEAEFKSSDFGHVTFKEWVYFINSTFGEATFEDVEFKGGANFTYAVFHIANFYNSEFEKRAYFENSEIKKNINFAYAEFHGELLLIRIKGKPFFIFYGTRFSDKTWIGGGTNLEKALFNFSRAEIVDFTGTEFPEKLYEEQLLEKKELNDEEKKYCPENWEEVSSIYRKLKQAHQRHGDYIKAGEFFYREMECKKKALREKRFSREWFRSFGYSFLKYSCGYGEKPGTVIRNSILAVFGFAFAYLFSNSINLSGNSVVRKFLQSLYFSTITFTTLGYGDIHPINDTGRILAMSEAIMGAIFIALFIFVFSRKMMR
ncbi:MAG TPA: hypothetical protein ENI51_03035, partial [Candidatus Atribacteria bacterium]|nr:hypothetical protein [Candidatus Atribacteria bacterium]